MVSYYLLEAAQEAGAVVAAGLPVGQIIPGDGVVLASDDCIYSRVVIANADPQTTLRLLNSAADPGWRAHVESIPMEGCTLKLNVWLNELPNFRARPGINEPHHYGQVNTPLTNSEWRESYDAARSGQLPGRLWTELYFQSVHDAAFARPARTP